MRNKLGLFLFVVLGIVGGVLSPVLTEEGFTTTTVAVDEDTTSSGSSSSTTTAVVDTTTTAVVDTTTTTELGSDGAVSLTVPSSTTTTVIDTTTTVVDTTATSAGSSSTTSTTVADKGETTSTTLGDPDPDSEGGDGEVVLPDDLTDEEIAVLVEAQRLDRERLLEEYRTQLESALSLVGVSESSIVSLGLDIGVLENEIVLFNALKIESEEEITSLVDEQAELAVAKSDLTDSLVTGSIDFFVNSTGPGAEKPDEMSLTFDYVREMWFEGLQEDSEFVDSEEIRVADEIVLLESRIVSTVSDVTLREGRIKALESEVGVLEDSLVAMSYGVDANFVGGVFPIAGTYGQPLIDSWGFPRSGGRSHEGIDIFAPSGTPLVAIESGVVTRIGSVGLGGQRIWLAGDSGTYWYYAHLSGYAEGMVPGDRVEAGDLVGYVGNTGNAATTPPHLHLQMHPGNGSPVNPYPTMKFLSDARNLALTILADADSVPVADDSVEG